MILNDPIKHQDEIKRLELEYFEKNKKAISENNKKYREDNRAKLKAFYSEKIQCSECGKNISRSYFAMHRKMKKHQKFNSH